MKKVMMISMLALSMTASAKGWPVDTLHQASVDNPFLQRLAPTLTTDYVQSARLASTGSSESKVAHLHSSANHWDVVTSSTGLHLHSMPTLASGSHQMLGQGWPFRD